jgi:UDPglucose 6-dehydrogenase/GDP-mannose 6-dehydrogenase
MNIAVIGAGYVGLVTAIGFAKKGFKVVCVDHNQIIVNSLNRGVIHFYENGLKSALKKVLNKNLFKATTNINEALKFSKIVFIAVGTPTKKGLIDLSQVESVMKDITNYTNDYKKYLSVVIKSTVVPGTTLSYIPKIDKKKNNFGMGMNPEFLREGSALKDFDYPDRIVIGHEDSLTKKRLEYVYSKWDCPKIYVNTKTAEMIKYVNNSLLATQISFINEMANLAERIGSINFDQVIKAIHLDRRWHSKIKNQKKFVNPEIHSYHIPGCGFGGSCFPKDIEAICALGLEKLIPMNLLKAVKSVNKKQPQNIVQNIKSYFNNNLKGIKVMVLGLSFKPNTDDIRNSTSLKIIKALLDQGSLVFCHDPLVKDIAIPSKNSRSNYSKNWRKDVLNCDCIIIATACKEYSSLINLDKKISGKLIYDCRRFFVSDNFKFAKYRTIGNT